MSLSAKQEQRIARIWAELDDAEMSTERLFAMVSERASRELGRDIDDGHVSDAIRNYAELAEGYQPKKARGTP